MEPLRGGDLGRPSPPPAVAAVWDTGGQKDLRWNGRCAGFWNHPEVTVVLSGMNEESHITENIVIAECSSSFSSGSDLQLIEKVSQTYRKIMKVGCTGCGYCQPCPAGVLIPRCFEIYNNMHMYNTTAEAPFMYVMRTCAL